MKPLGKMEIVDVRSVWANEASDFTPWLAQDENIAMLGEAIGLELEVETVEMAVGPYSADILARDTGTGKYVVIENQFGKTNHDHLGKAITYGSVLDAAALVWIASDFTDEHKRALDWLNEYTSEELSFYGVRVELVKIDGSNPAVRFNVVSKPAKLKKPDVIGPGELTESRKTQFEFWTAVREQLLAKKVIPSAQVARPQYWFDVPLGRSNFVLSNIANTSEGRIGVRVYLTNKVADIALPQLLEQKEKIEGDIGGKLQWNPFPDKRDKIISLSRDAALDDRSKWPEYITWMVTTIDKFKKVFGPAVKALKLVEDVKQPQA